MGIQIGPITLDSLEGQSWSISRRSETVGVPFGRSYSTTTGMELISYDLSGLVKAATDAAARLLRQQLQDLFNNHSLDFVYIAFDHDSPEFSGWYILDRLSMSLDAHIFGAYPFAASVRRLAAHGGLTEAQYFHAVTLTNDYSSLTPRPWTALVNGRGGASHDLRTGQGGSNRIVANANDAIIPYDHPAAPDVYAGGRCRIFDTRTNLFSPHNAVDPDETDWLERFGNNIHFEGDAVVDNGLIRYVALRAGGHYIYLWAGSYWERVADPPDWAFGDSPINASSTRLISIEYFDWDRITFLDYQDSQDNRGAALRWTLRRGTYFFEIETASRIGTILATSEIVSPYSTTLGAFDNDVATANYASARVTAPVSGNQYHFGFLHTETATPAGSSGGSYVRVQLGVTVAEDAYFKVAYFAVPHPLPSGLTKANLGLEFLSGSTTRRVLVDPEWVN